MGGVMLVVIVLAILFLTGLMAVPVTRQTWQVLLAVFVALVLFKLYLVRK